MGFITDIVKGLPIAAVQEAKIAAFEKKFAELEAENKQLRLDNERMKKLLEEEVRVARGVEFRRGQRTGGRWLPFCPKCGLPVEEDHGRRNLPVQCSSCDWYVQLQMRELSSIIAGLPK